MKNWKQIILVALIVAFVVISLAWILVTFKSKAIITTQLKKVFQKDVKIGAVKIENPFMLGINKLEIEGVAKIDEVYISPSILGLLTGKIALNRVKLVNPEFVFEKKKAPEKGPSPSLPQQQAKSVSLSFGKGKKEILLIIKRFNIKNGKLRFIDRTVGQEGITILVEKINFDVNNFYMYPKAMVTDFHLTGAIPWGKGSQAGTIQADGWANIFEKDIQAKVNIANIDAVYLAPYYKDYVSLEKARIQKARMNFSADIHGLDNEITSNCHLELVDIVFLPKAKEEEGDTARTQQIVSTVLDIFKATNNGKIVLDFTYKTKMDEPIFGFDNIRMAIDEKVSRGWEERNLDLDDILGAPGKLLSGTLIGAKEVSKNLISSIHKAFSEPFKKSNGNSQNSGKTEGQKLIPK